MPLPLGLQMPHTRDAGVDSKFKPSNDRSNAMTNSIGSALLSNTSQYCRNDLDIGVGSVSSTARDSRSTYRRPASFIDLTPSVRVAAADADPATPQPGLATGERNTVPPSGLSPARNASEYAAA